MYFEGLKTWKKTLENMRKQQFTCKLHISLCNTTYKLHQSGWLRIKRLHWCIKQKQIRVVVLWLPDTDEKIPHLDQSKLNLCHRA